MEKRLSEKDEFIAIDWFRMVFAIGIVVLHLKPFSDINASVNYFLCDVLTRLAVPFFFITSGFFLEKKIHHFEKTKRYVFHILKFYLLYSILYFPQSIYRWRNRDYSVPKYIVEYAKYFFLSGSYIQLWYFCGLIFAVIFLYILLNKIKITDKNRFLFVVILYVIGTIGNAYITPLQKSLTAAGTNIPTSGLDFLLWLYFKLFRTTRNGLFFGLPFLFIGSLISKYKQQILFTKKYIFFAFLSFCLMTAEVYVTKTRFGCHGADMLFSLIPAATFLFLMIAFCTCSKTEKNLNKAKYLRALSVLYFGLHLFLRFYVSLFFEKIWHIKLNSFVCFLIVVALNFVCAQKIIKLSKKYKWLTILYL